MAAVELGKPGLHNRITVNIPLFPFTLSETAAYLNYRDNQFNENQVLQIAKRHALLLQGTIGPP